MNGFSYTYASFEKIIGDIKLVNELFINEYIILFFLIVVIFSMIYYFIPYIIIIKENSNILKEKTRKKNFIRQIAIQKDLEDEIEKEIKEIELKLNN